MHSKVEQTDNKTEIKRYQVQYPISAYTFPTETVIHEVRLDDEYIHVALTDGRILLYTFILDSHRPPCPGRRA